MYELLVLSLLMHWPLHAYRIAKIANQIIGPEEQVSTGTLSTLLNRLVQAGLIISVEPEATPFPSDRPSRVFAITPAGRERFLQLMLDTTSHPTTYRKLFHIKALHLELIPPQSQIFLIEHFVAYCQQLLDAKQAEGWEVARHPLKQEHMQSALRQTALALIQLKIEQWQLELAWAQSLRTQILSRFQQQGETVPISKEEVPDLHDENRTNL